MEKDPSQCVRIAADEAGAVVGWAHAAEQLVLESGPRCELLGIVVDASARGAGAGRALVSAVETWAAGRQLPVIVLRCNVLRTEAHAFYGRLGFERAKTQTVLRKRLIRERP